MKNSVFSMKLSKWKLYLQFPNIFNLKITIPKLRLNLKRLEYHGKVHFCHHIGETFMYSRFIILKMKYFQSHKRKEC